MLGSRRGSQRTAIVLVLLLAAAILWVLFREDATTPLESDPRPPESDRAEQPSDPAVADARKITAPPTPKRRRLAAGLVIGKLLDPAGDPVAEANVYLVGARYLDPPFARPPRDPVRHARQRALEGAAFRYVDLKTRQTREDGSFVFVGHEVPDEHRVEAHVLLSRGGSSLLEPAPIVLDQEELDGRPLTLACRWGTTVDLHCRFPRLAGDPPRVQVTLGCTPRDGGGFEFLDSVSLALPTTGLRLLGFPPGTYAAWIQGRHGVAVGSPFRVEEGTPVRGVELTTGPATLVVRVFDERGGPHPLGALVTVSGVAASEGRGAAALPYELHASASRHEPALRFPGLPPGLTRIEVALASGEPQARTVSLGGGDHEEHFVLPTPAPKPCVVQGRVQTSEGAPLTATLKFHDGALEGDRRFPDLLKECCTDAQGRFLIESLPARTLLIAVSAPGQRTRLLRLETRKDRPMEVCWALLPLHEGMPPAIADPDAAAGPTGKAAGEILKRLLAARPEVPRVMRDRLTGAPLSRPAPKASGAKTPEVRGK